MNDPLVVPVTYCGDCTQLQMPICSCAQGGNVHHHHKNTSKGSSTSSSSSNREVHREIHHLKEAVTRLEEIRYEAEIMNRDGAINSNGLSIVSNGHSPNGDYESIQKYTRTTKCKYATELESLNDLQQIYESDKKNFNANLVPQEYQWLRKDVRPVIRKRDMLLSASGAALENFGKLSMKSMDAMSKFAKSETAAQMASITKQVGKSTIDLIHNYAVQDCGSNIQGQKVDFGDLITGHEGVYSTQNNNENNVLRPLSDGHFLTLPDKSLADKTVELNLNNIRMNKFAMGENDNLSPPHLQLPPLKQVSLGQNNNEVEMKGEERSIDTKTVLNVNRQTKIEVPEFVSENGIIENKLPPLKPSGVTVTANTRKNNQNAKIIIRGENVDPLKCSAKRNGYSVEIKYDE